MAVNLIELVTREFSDDVVEKLAGVLGESATKTRAGVNYAVPAVFCALQQKALAPRGADELFGLFQRSGFDGRSFSGLSQLFGSSTGVADMMKVGGPLLASLFGQRQSALLDWLASTVGISRNSITSLLNLVAPFVMSYFAKQAVASGGLTLSNLTSLITGQGSFLRGVAPAGLAQALGVSGCGEAAATRAPAPPVRQESGLGWLKWLLPLLALTALIIGWRACRTEPVEVVAPKSVVEKPAPKLAPVTVVLVKRALTCGQELDMAANGVEAQLLDFIEDTSRVVDDKTWFSFDRLEFDFASPVLQPGSQAQLRNIAEIMRCYPNLHLKIGGYTDNVGDPASNLQLSQARAENTTKALVDLGVDSGRLAAEGYGEQFPVASNDTEEGRQRNRRIDLRVTQK